MDDDVTDEVLWDAVAEVRSGYDHLGDLAIRLVHELDELRAMVAELSA